MSRVRITSSGVTGFKNSSGGLVHSNHYSAFIQCENNRWEEEEQDDGEEEEHDSGEEEEQHNGEEEG